MIEKLDLIWGIDRDSKAEKINELIEMVNHHTARIVSLQHKSDIQCAEEHAEEQEQIAAHLIDTIRKNYKTKTTGLTFEEAMVFLRQGKKIIRYGWMSGYAVDYSESPTGLDGNDLIATDWEVKE